MTDPLRDTSTTVAVGVGPRVGQCVQSRTGIPKIKYVSEREAQESLDRPLSDRNGLLPRPYKCQFCGLWHVGTKRMGVRRAG